MTRSEHLSRRDWLKGAAVGLAPLGLAPLSFAAAIGLPPARKALAWASGSSSALDALSLSPQWLNGPAPTPTALAGKVVLVAFWTYSCINSLRVLPYLRAWHARYRDRGLVAIGVHTPEFAFEKDVANVRQALSDLDVPFPVVLDSDWRIWRAYGNNAWPAFYFVGADGKVRGHAAGEGDYDRHERRIQALLAQVPGPAIAEGLSPIKAVGPEAAPDFAELGSPESYIGWGKADAFASPGGLRQDVAKAYRLPGALDLNRWGLAGEWRAGEEFTTSLAPGAAIASRFHARDLHMVLAPDQPGRPLRYRVRLDGQPPSPDHGWDVAADGTGVIDRPRMYQLVRQSRPVADRGFEITFLDPGVRAYAFTFG